jgi:hypothetical protein
MSFAEVCLISWPLRSSNPVLANGEYGLRHEDSKLATEGTRPMLTGVPK